MTAYGSVYGAGTPVGRPLRPGETLTAFRRYAENEDGAFMMLEKLGELKAKGILTDDEFNAKKTELLKKLV